MNADYPSTKTQPKLTAADYHGTSIQLIEKDGSRWLTARDLGLCLGYSEANARQGILNLYNRHLDEFTEQDSVVIKLTTVDGKAGQPIFTTALQMAYSASRGVENLVNSGLPHPTLWFFYARTGNPVMPGGQRIQHPRGESSRLTVYSFRTPRHPYNRESSKNLNRSQS